MSNTFKKKRAISSLLNLNLTMFLLFAYLTVLFCCLDKILLCKVVLKLQILLLQLPNAGNTGVYHAVKMVQQVKHSPPRQLT